MNLTPGPGFIFAVPIDRIPEKSKTGAGFGLDHDKKGPEAPYRFRVEAVGGPKPFEGQLVPAPVKVGDEIILALHNHTLRDKASEAGFIVEGVWYMPLDFGDVMGVYGEAV